ncbi:MAG: hypothetical protein OWV35_12755, partial [Firmicutes bacterium]|nr:hypothetical protein [Bacillota bacterium]
MQAVARVVVPRSTWPDRAVLRVYTGSQHTGVVEGPAVRWHYSDAFGGDVVAVVDRQAPFVVTYEVARKPARWIGWISSDAQMQYHPDTPDPAIIVRFAWGERPALRTIREAGRVQVAV